jgi:hypothetical protein
MYMLFVHTAPGLAKKPEIHPIHDYPASNCNDSNWFTIINLYGFNLYCIICGIMQTLFLEGLRNTKKISIRTTGVPAEKRRDYLPNTSRKYYLFGQLL